MWLIIITHNTDVIGGTLMYEKISEQGKRAEKVAKVKAKIFKEIEQCLKKNIQDFQYCLKQKETDKEYLDYLVQESFALIQLREYIEKEERFFIHRDRYPALDTIVYYVSDKTLNIWLQEDYNFALRFLVEFENLEIPDVFIMLDENFLEFNIATIMDRALYKEK